jgi:hypothetical protein
MVIFTASGISITINDEASLVAGCVIAAMVLLLGWLRPRH